MKTTETYSQLRERQQKEFNEVPIGAAFSDNQFIEMMKKWNLCNGKDGKPTDDDLKKIYHLVSGAYIQKKDAPLLHETRARHEKELKDAIKNDKTGENFIYQMFLYELNNFEYGYTGDPTDALESLGYTLDEINKNPRLKAGFEKAKRTIWDAA